MEYAIRPIDPSPGELAATADLMHTVFPRGMQMPPDYLRWQYQANPAGQAVGFNAFAGRELAAHYVTLPLVAQLEGRLRKGLMSLNTATHPSHQGKGLFTRLAEATYADAARRGYEFVVGVANANSTPGFVRKLGFQLVSPLAVHLGLGHGRARGTDRPGFRIHWDEELLRWRLASPIRTYWISTHARRGVTAIETRSRYPGIRAVLAEVDQELMRGFAERPPQRAYPLRLWMGLHQTPTGPPLASLRMPEWAKPYPLNLIFRALDPKLALLDPAQVSFQTLDFDLY